MPQNNPKQEAYKAPQQRHSKATIKQHDNTQELDEILANLTTAASDDQFIDDGSIGDAKADILDWHNKQIEEVLDRLEDENSIFKDYRYKDGVLMGTEIVGEGIPLSAIQAERNKLKET